MAAGRSGSFQGPSDALGTAGARQVGLPSWGPRPAQARLTCQATGGHGPPTEGWGRQMKGSPQPPVLPPWPLPDPGLGGGTPCTQQAPDLCPLPPPHQQERAGGSAGTGHRAGPQFFLSVKWEHGGDCGGVALPLGPPGMLTVATGGHLGSLRGPRGPRPEGTQDGSFPSSVTAQRCWASSLVARPEPLYALEEPAEGQGGFTPGGGQHLLRPYCLPVPVLTAGCVSAQALNRPQEPGIL